MKDIDCIEKIPSSLFNNFFPFWLPHTSEEQPASASRMLVRFTTRPEQHSPFLQRTRSYQQFPTFSGAQHSSVYYWVPTTRLPGPGGHSSTVGGFGYPVDLELARSAPQRSGSTAVAPLCNPPREGQDGAGTHHRGEEAPRWPQAARAVPARHRPGAAGAGRAEAREPRPGRREGDRAGWGHRQGAPSQSDRKAERESGSARGSPHPTALTRLRGVRAPSPPPPHTKAPARRARPDEEAAPPAAARLSIRRAAHRAGPGRPRRPARSAPRRPGGGSAPRRTARSAPRRTGGSSAPRRPGGARSPHLAPGE